MFGESSLQLIWVRSLLYYTTKAVYATQQMHLIIETHNNPLSVLTLEAPKNFTGPARPVNEYLLACTDFYWSWASWPWAKW